MPRGNLHDDKSRSRRSSPERSQGEGGSRQPRRNVDEEVVSLRERGKSYAAVASALGLKRTTDAHAAFVRVLRSRPEAERAALSSRESQRLDQLEQRIRTRDAAGTRPSWNAGWSPWAPCARSWHSGDGGLLGRRGARPRRQGLGRASRTFYR